MLFIFKGRLKVEGRREGDSPQHRQFFGPRVNLRCLHAI